MKRVTKIDVPKKVEKVPAKPGPVVELVSIPAMDVKVAKLSLIGTSRLVCHAWGKKAKGSIGGGGRRKPDPKADPAPRDPVAEYEASLYRGNGDGYWFPALAFKLAAVSAARQIDGLAMTLLRGAFHVLDDFVQIEGTPRMREDTVNVGGKAGKGSGSADLRYRADFGEEWSVTIRIRYNAAVITLQNLLNLYAVAGFAVGVGEWRPERDGNWGMFRVAGMEDLKNA